MTEIPTYTHELSLGLDPAYGKGKRPGVAAVLDGRLIAVDSIKVPGKVSAEPDLGARIDAIAELVGTWFRMIAVEGRVRRACGDRITLVYEWPQIYGVGSSKGDPNDLPGLAALGAAVARELRPNRVVTPKPREWQGGTSKNLDAPKDSSRYKRLAAILKDRPGELALIPDDHDAIDAVGLAFHVTPSALALPRRVKTRGLGR